MRTGTGTGWWKCWICRRPFRLRSGRETVCLRCRREAERAEAALEQRLRAKQEEER